MSANLNDLRVRIFTDVKNYHDKLTKYTLLFNTVLKSDVEYGGLSFSFSNGNVLVVQEPELSSLLDEAESFLLPDRMSHYLHAKLLYVSSALPNGDLFVSRLDELGKDLAKTTCYSSVLSKQFDSLNNAQERLEGIEEDLQFEPLVKEAIEQCTYDYGFNTGQYPFDYAFFQYEKISSFVAKAALDGVDINKAHLYTNDKVAEYNDYMATDYDHVAKRINDNAASGEFDQAIVDLQSARSAQKKTFDHYHSLKSAEVAKAEYSHALCTKYSLFKAKEFSDNFENNLFRNLLDLKPQLQSEYGELITDYNQSNRALFSVKAHEEMNAKVDKVVSGGSEDILKDVYDKLVSISQTKGLYSKAFPVLSSFGGNPAGIYQLYFMVYTNYFSELTESQKDNAKNFYSDVSPVYDEFCDAYYHEAQHDTPQHEDL